MNSCEHAQQRYVNDLIELEDPFIQYEYLIELATELAHMTEEERERAHVVEGCQSHVWLSVSGSSDEMTINADSDTMIIRGVLAVIIDVYSGRPAEEILNTPFCVLEKAGASSLLSDERRGGIKSVMRDICKAGQAMLEKCPAK